MKKYQSREYCNDINCINQRFINILGKTEKLEKICYKCEAYKFHQWLKDNGYKIVKE